MKKRMSVLLILTALVVNVLSVTGLAASERSIANPVTKEHVGFQGEHTNSKPIITITEEEFKQLLQESSMEQAQPQAVTCCDRTPSLAWRHRSTMHITQQGGGQCLSLAYFGDQYCRWCGSIWQSNVCYEQTSSGCGQYHN